MTAPTEILPLNLRLTRGLAALILSVKRGRAFAELARLDERMLRDIGLSRVDVEAMRRMW